MNYLFVRAATCATDQGRKRPVNQDVCHADTATNCYLVADGMGGAAAGEIASSIFLDTALQRFASGADGSMEEAVADTFASANAAMQEHVLAVPEHRGMGCTAELLAIDAAGYVIGHVGDSRSYLLRNNKLLQLTLDHSLVQDQVNRGILSDADARGHLLRNILSRAVGTQERVEVDILKGILLPGDMLLLCTDGLHGLVSAEDIAGVLAFSGPLALKASMLIDLANHAGGRDNIAVTLVEIAGDSG